MNKKFFTLAAAFGLAATSFTTAQAAATDLVKDGYYYIQTESDWGNTTAKAMRLAVTKNYLGTVADSIVAWPANNTTGNYASDSALWKVSSEVVATTGLRVYTITNKAVPAARLSFGNSNKVVSITQTGSTFNAGVAPSKLTGNQAFVFYASAGVEAAAQTETAGVLSCYNATKDSTLQIAINAIGTAPEVDKSYEVLPMMNDGKTAQFAEATAKTAASIVKLQFMAATAKVLTVKELNAMKKEGGFQLFGKYDGVAVDSNNPLAGVTFKAVKVQDNPEVSPVYDATDANVAVFLEAVSLPKKEGRPQYLFVDTTTFATNAAEGEFLKMKVDTLPRLTGTAFHSSSNSVLTAAAYQFVITTDPSHPVDSVAVFATGSYKLNDGGATPPRTFSLVSGGKYAALQLEVVNGTKVLTTKMNAVTSASGTTSATGLSASSRFAFTGTTTVPAVLALDKVYSVKNVNDRTASKEETGKYKVVDLSGTATYSSAVYKSVPATQFIYTGSTLVNREVPGVSVGSISAVADKADTYTNGTDTFEIKAIDGVNVKEKTIGYAYMSADSLKNYAFSLDYVSGLLEGLSINATKDSSVIASEDAAALFKLEAVTKDTKYGAENEKIAQLEKTTYKIYRKEIVDGKKTYVVIDATTGRLMVTNETSQAGSAPAAFFLKNVNDEGEVILMNAAGNKKFNVNSTTAKLEEVALTAGNNAFKVQVEKAPAFVLDAAQKHITFTNGRGDKLTADKNNFAVFRTIGEELKATYNEADFALYVDTAQGLVQKPTEPTYYILKGAKTGEKAALEGDFLRVMTDSIDVEGYSILVNNVAKAKLAFVPAKRLAAGGDSLIVNYQNEVLTKNDSVGFKGKKAGIDQFRFKVQYTENDGEYVLRNTTNYVAVLNDIIFLTDKANEAAVLSTEAVSAPTANEGVEVSEVKVIAGEGQVTIAGAAGKKVVISNILGQKVANTVITSDNAVIAAPQGVVVVAVEGDDTVKAIVK